MGRGMNCWKNLLILGRHVDFSDWSLSSLWYEKMKIIIPPQSIASQSAGEPLFLLCAEIKKNCPCSISPPIDRTIVCMWAVTTYFQQTLYSGTIKLLFILPLLQKQDLIVMLKKSYLSSCSLKKITENSFLVIFLKRLV